MKKTLFTGVATAIVTPFDKNGEIDFNSLEKIVRYNLDGKVGAIVVCGTTGEASTLTYQERIKVIQTVIGVVSGSVPVIAGVGSNNFNSTQKMINDTQPLGVNGFLIVTPYYNKTTQEGLKRIYTLYAQSTPLPIILYNVPSRTGIGFLPETYKSLMGIENIIGVKEASADMVHFAQSINLCPDLDFYSGCDDLLLPALSLGAKGVVSVVSNILPTQIQQLCTAYFKGDILTARNMQLNYLELIKALFCQVNPIPVKYALSKMGLIKNYLRLPLVPLSQDKVEQMDTALKNLGII